MNQILSKHQQMGRFRPKMDATRVSKCSIDFLLFYTLLSLYFTYSHKFPIALIAGSSHTWLQLWDWPDRYQRGGNTK